MINRDNAEFIRNTILWVLWLLVIPLIWITASWTYAYDYVYAANVESHLVMASDAPTVSMKLQKMLLYRAAVNEYVKGKDSRLIYHYPNYYVVAQKKVLNDIIHRLGSMNQMDPKSVQYQQALIQIEDKGLFSTRSDYNQVFFGAYARQGGWHTFMLAHWIYGLFLLITFLVVAICATVNIKEFFYDQYYVSRY